MWLVWILVGLCIGVGGMMMVSNGQYNKGWEDRDNLYSQQNH
jgi:hypothetical protein